MEDGGSRIEDRGLRMATCSVGSEAKQSFAAVPNRVWDRGVWDRGGLLDPLSSILYPRILSRQVNRNFRLPALVGEGVLDHFIDVEVMDGILGFFVIGRLARLAFGDHD
jgi:hypothetical protein